MAAPKPQPGIAKGLHMAFRGGRRHPTHHRSRIYFALLTPRRPEEETSVGRHHLVIGPGTNRQLSDTQRETHHRQYIDRQPSLRVLGPHPSHRSSARSAPQHNPPHPDYPRLTSHLPTASIGTGPGRHC
jgi:hypothetical protein